MATKKASKTKSAKGSSQKGGKTEQVDDPIIIKGGSVSVQFDGNTKFKKDNSNPKNKFDHKDPDRQLTRLVVLRRNSTTGTYDPIPGGRIPLQREDRIVVCYTGSSCA